MGPIPDAAPVPLLLVTFVVLNEISRESHDTISSQLHFEYGELADEFAVGAPGSREGQTRFVECPGRITASILESADRDYGPLGRREIQIPVLV
jgi:hypothetical protein